MEIRTPQKHYKELTKNPKFPVHVDPNVKVPVIMYKNQDGALVEKSRGLKRCLSLQKYGYERIIKECPYKRSIFKKRRKCSGENCQFYLVHNLVGDCIKKWMFFK